MTHISKYPLALAVIALTTTPALAIDPCLLGAWEPDYLVLGDQYLEASGATQVDISGHMYMTFADTGVGTYLAENLTFDVINEGMPRTEVTLNGTGEFSADTTDGAFIMNMGPFLYNAHAIIHMGGEPMEMDIPFTEEMAPFGGALGAYECSDDLLEFTPTITEGEPNVRIAKRWYRL
ncbi:MAG: hypothetical protein V3V13_01160 [Paracoccaceae bacterium]